MSKLRGDDALHSLMEEFSTQQGYQHDDNVEAKADSRKAVDIPRIRLTAEVAGYDPAKEQVVVYAGSRCIWNPYIRTLINEEGISLFHMFPPTNPFVEVFRRRSFERFKSEFRAIFERVGANNNPAAAPKRSPNNLWKDLATPSLLERWHFDAKLEENLMLRERCTDRTHPSWPVHDTDCAAEIQAWMTKRRAAGTRLMDPILMSGSHTPLSDKERGRHSFHLQSPSSILGDELKFEWTRTWRRIQGDRDNNETTSTLADVFASNGYRKKVAKIWQAVRNRASEAEESLAKEIVKRAALEGKLSSNKMNHRHSNKSLPKVVMGDDDDEVYVKFSGLSFRLHQEHYHKLQILFDRMHPHSPDEVTHKAAFVSSLFCLLTRYDMLQGAGLQSSMHGAVFDTLLKFYDCRMECFASPLNCRYERYCSAFPDTDTAFGSVGSFFDYNFAAAGGCYQANPPFTTNFIRSMYRTMDQAFNDCSDDDKSLMFVVFVPAWDDTDGWKALHESIHLSRHVSLSQASHYYCEGTQHRRKERYRVASFDTSVFFLQNERAREQWPVTDDQIEELRAVFAINPEEEEETVGSVTSGKKNMEKGRIGIVKSEKSTPALESTRKETPSWKPPSKKKKKNKKSDSKKGIKRKLLRDDNEGNQQLDILNSLGLGPDLDSVARMSSNGNGNAKKMR